MSKSQASTAEKLQKQEAESVATVAKKPKWYRFDWKTGEPKPIMRGWIHTVATPLSLAASIVLVVLAPTTPTRWASAVYLATSLILFGMSSVYHMGSWGKTADGVLRRFDHANIFLLIAGTYTPMAVAMLEPTKRTILLSIVWGGAALGILGRVFWINASRWLYTPLYVILGWVALAYLQDFWAHSVAVVWLLVAGGLLYTLGAVVYASKWPDPSPRVFGFHEIFHAATVAAWSCHCVAAYLAVLNAGA